MSRKQKGSILFPLILSVIISGYSYFTGQVLWGIIAVLMILAFKNSLPARAIIMKDPFLLVISIVIIFYSFYEGLVLHGVITVILVIFIWGRIRNT